MLRRTFLKATGALFASLCLFRWHRRVKRVTLTYEGEEVSLREMCAQVCSVNSVTLAGVPPEQMLCMRNTWEQKYRTGKEYIQVTVIYERGDHERLTRINDRTLFPLRDPILKSIPLVRQQVEYA